MLTLADKVKLVDELISDDNESTVRDYINAVAEIELEVSGIESTVKSNYDAPFR